MESPKDEEQKPTATKAQPPEKPTRKRNQVKIQPRIRAPKPTPTAVLCELTRLKAQQKYLECNQVKLNPNNFILKDDTDTDTDSKTRPCEEPETGQNPRPTSSSTADLISLINEIEQEKLVLNEKLKLYCSEKRGELQDMWHYVATIKEDVFRPERLSQYTVNALRERIVGLNAQLYRLAAQNSKELEELKAQYDKLESENKMLWKGSM
ncbi:uncharacterized protein LOC26526403 [Drosophila erecta]|uniref:Uncharacterized protein n=1 Tax=Drosophila erecta TaxID=7220 RepID=A0A0Q5VKY8_DROER|nr:uncharacterized protein LOC26526403 [Drosophila erecta]KQS62103.1 uncharacterized protein Dere_GG26579 [Drosophila erecta]